MADAEMLPGPSWLAPTGDDVTLVEGSSFCVGDRVGDIAPHRAHGSFFMDTRIVSTWQLTVDDAPLDPLAVIPQEPFAATFVTRAAPRPGSHEPTIVVERRRLVASGMREDLVLHNYGSETAGCRLVLTVDADFADLFDVKEGRPSPHRAVHRRVTGDELEISVDYPGQCRAVRIRGAGAIASPGGLSFVAAVPAQGEWRATLEVLPSAGGSEVESPFPLDVPLAQAHPSRRMADWRASRPRITADHPGVQETLRRSVMDLGALRIMDPAHPGTDVVAAGAPWFMALFGRDSLITGWLALPFDPSLALGTLQTLARLQGSREDLMSEEEPGRILHEVRLGVDASRALGGSHVYYGSVDATPLFVILLDEVARWGAPWQAVLHLLPAADRALQWIEQYGDLDGDGFVEYRRKTDRGLQNQGWKDSHDGVNYADGRIATAPIALAEVNAYVYGAYRARAHLAELAGDEAGRARWAAKAADHRHRFNEAFWMEERGYYAIALDGAKGHVDALASNAGQCLWTGVAEPAQAKRLAGHLLSPEMFTGWGIRTLASSMTAYNPVSYHNGSIWPHDNALITHGLMRYGLVEDAQQVASGIMAAAEAFGGRLPELFCGFNRGQMPVPVPYPSSCSPQAWAAASPIGLLRTLMRLQPCVPHRVVSAAPALPRSWGNVHIENLPMNHNRLHLDTDKEQLITEGLPADIEIVAGPIGDDVCAEH